MTDHDPPLAHARGSRSQARAPSAADAQQADLLAEQPAGVVFAKSGRLDQRDRLVGGGVRPKVRAWARQHGHSSIGAAARAGASGARGWPKGGGETAPRPCGQTSARGDHGGRRQHHQEEGDGVGHAAAPIAAAPPPRHFALGACRRDAPTRSPCPPSSCCATARAVEPGEPLHRLGGRGPHRARRGGGQRGRRALIGAAGHRVRPRLRLGAHPGDPHRRPGARRLPTSCGFRWSRTGG